MLRRERRFYGVMKRRLQQRESIIEETLIIWASENYREIAEIRFMFGVI